jgi:multiple sugar transport system permease protein
LVANESAAPATYPVRRRRTPRARGTAGRSGWPFVVPTVAFLAVVTIVPGACLYYISLYDYTMGRPLSSRRWVGAGNYTTMLSGADRAFWPSVWVTLLLLVVTVGLSVLIGLALALLLQRTTGWAARIFGTLFLVPMVITPVMAGLIWRLMFNNLYGVLNGLLQPFGIAPNWLGSPSLAVVSVCAVEIWMWTPFVTLVLFAGLGALPAEPFEAAQVDGAGGWTMLRYHTLPMLKPIIGLVIALRMIDGLKIFDTPFALTGGGPGNATETLGLLVFHDGLFQTGFIGKASAAAVLLLILVSVISRYVAKFLTRAENLKG